MRLKTGSCAHEPTPESAQPGKVHVGKPKTFGKKTTANELGRSSRNVFQKSNTKEELVHTTVFFMKESSSSPCLLVNIGKINKQNGQSKIQHIIIQQKMAEWSKSAERLTRGTTLKRNVNMLTKHISRRRHDRHRAVEVGSSSHRPARSAARPHSRGYLKMREAM